MNFVYYVGGGVLVGDFSYILDLVNFVYIGVLE